MQFNKALQSSKYHQGLTLVELMATLAIAALLFTGLNGLVGNALNLETETRDQLDLTRQAHFAMQRMVSAVQSGRRLILPLADNPHTNWPEHIRSQTFPASPPVGDSIRASAVLAVTLDPTRDFNNDGWSDANNDQDYLDLNNNGVRDSGEPERIDEDLGGDNSNDGMPGLIDIDDDGDGRIDQSAASIPQDDNDEDNTDTDDLSDGADNDGDGSIDEDSPADMNKDGMPGLAGVDDDLDGYTDEGKKNDDDEDGLTDEDGLDPVVFYLNGASLTERLPAFTDKNGDSVINGADYTETVIADKVRLLRIERLPQEAGRALLLDITLELSGDIGTPVRLNSRIRPGAAL
ncbi:MAG: prepilin-type N-terminal cleavage/methylation domain-containing protein [Pontibacterium sp.]